MDGNQFFGDPTTCNFGGDDPQYNDRCQDDHDIDPLVFYGIGQGRGDLQPPKGQLLPDQQRCQEYPNESACPGNEDALYKIDPS